MPLLVCCCGARIPDDAPTIMGLDGPQSIKCPNVEGHAPGTAWVSYRKALKRGADELAGISPRKTHPKKGGRF